VKSSVFATSSTFIRIIRVLLPKKSSLLCVCDLNFKIVAQNQKFFARPEVSIVQNNGDSLQNSAEL
jgi:hypothetical protein